MIFPTSRLVGCVIVPWRRYLKVFHHKGSNSVQLWYKVVSAGSEQQKDTNDMDQDTSQDSQTVFPELSTSQLNGWEVIESLPKKLLLMVQKS